MDDRVTSTVFGSAPAGTVDAFTLTNAAGWQVRVMTYGAVILSARVADRDGRLGNVVLGYEDLESYLRDRFYTGAAIGRFANRIAGAQVVLDGRTYTLAANDGPHHLHGGVDGFHKVVWRAEPFETDGRAGVVFAHHSPDGHEGYPGNLRARITYTLTDRGELIADYRATTDQPTPLSLTQHTYFNLAGADGGDVLEHELTVPADRFAPIDEMHIPTGTLRDVTGTPFDFRRPTRIGAHIDLDHEQLRHGDGYDHSFVLSRPTEAQLAHAARLFEPRSGRVLDVHTTEPALHVYSGNLLADRRRGLCLETQHLPDSPNKPQFPSTILLPGAEYRSTTVFAFRVVP